MNTQGGKMKKGAGKYKYDKGYKGSNSGSMGTDYRGNNYNSLKDSIEREDRSKLSGQKATKY